jgi:hypothetical protein
MINDLHKSGIKSLAVACLVFNLTPADFVKADQPVHCLRDDAYGEWDFHVSTEVDSINLFQADEVCTHKRPNHIQIMNEAHQFKFEKEEVWKMKLLPNYVAQAQGPSTSVAGTWSTIYDQAMRVELENGTRYITNFRYNIKPDISGDPLKDGSDKFEGTQTGDYQSFDSVCSETMVGFVQKVHGQGSLTDHKAQCFFAK